MKYIFLILGLVLLIIGLIDLKNGIAKAANGKFDWSHFVIVTMSELVIGGLSTYLAYFQFTQ